MILWLRQPGLWRSCSYAGLAAWRRSRVELTMTTPWASTAGYLFAAASVPDTAAALTKAAERATELGATPSER